MSPVLHAIRAGTSESDVEEIILEMVLLGIGKKMKVWPYEND